MQANLFSTITCPRCGHKKEEIMPVNACQYFYECTGCSEILKPKRGDCCVYCSYGTEVCPPVQTGRESC
ncbi:MAG: GDCCVxC domain-containing (seleno)protein [Bacteroidota bacterium]